MADRTCPSCGADVSSASAFCPRCGADLEARLIELGGATPARPGRTPRRARPRRTRLLAGVAAVVVGGLAVTTLVGDDADDAEPDAGRSGEDAEATTTTLTDLSDLAPLLGEESGLFVVIRGQATVLVDLDDGSIDDIGPFEPSGSTDDAFVASGELGVQLWPAPYQESSAYLLDELGASTALLGATVAWAIEEGEARALRLDEVGLVAQVPLPSGAVPVGVVGDTLVVAAPGGTFTIGVDGRTDHLTAGTAVAAGHDLLAVSVCDDALSCSIQTMDLDGTVLQTVPLTGDRAVSAAAIGPDGQVAWISGGPGDGEVFVDGRSLFPLPSAASATLAWSPDGRWLVGSVGRSDILVVDIESGLGRQVIDLGRNVYPEELFVVSR